MHACTQTCAYRYTCMHPSAYMRTPVPIRTCVHDTRTDCVSADFRWCCRFSPVSTGPCPAFLLPTPCPFRQRENWGPGTVVLAQWLSAVACLGLVGSGPRRPRHRGRQAPERSWASPSCVSSPGEHSLPVVHQLDCHAVDVSVLLVNGVFVFYFLIFFVCCWIIEIPLLFFMLTLCLC